MSAVVHGCIAWLRRHRVACFGLMTLSFVAFGLLTLDLVRVVGANWTLLSDHGVQALQDGGLRQLAELALSSVAAMAAWLLFKLCETLLVQSLTR
jgi:hypothetical protein